MTGPELVNRLVAILVLVVCAVIYLQHCRRVIEVRYFTGHDPTAPTVGQAMALMEVAAAEEITFRLGIQSLLAWGLGLTRRRYWIAVVFATTLWSMAHTGVLVPNWVKMAQIMPAGIVLGLLFRRYGLEICFLVHAAFNVMMMFVSPYVIGF